METVTGTSAQMAKSSNNHNKLYVEVEALDPDLTLMIEEGKLGPKTDIKERTKILTEQFQWDKTDAQRVWCFGPEECGPNILVDTTKGVQYLTEIKAAVMSGFQIATLGGVLCNERMRGLRFNITDVKVHSDPAHRKDGLIQNMAINAFLGTQLAAEPRLQEPVFLCEIQTPGDVVGNIYQLMGQRRGQVVSEEPIMGTPMVNIQAHLPVSESFGLADALRAATGGRAAPQCIFDHWQELNSDPLENGSKSSLVVTQIRKRKGLKKTVPPPLEEFVEKMPKK